MALFSRRSSGLTLPPRDAPFGSPEGVALYAQRCLEALELRGWQFAYDRAVRRLGCCRPAQRRISLSRAFTLHFLERDEALIKRTLRHELAHALAWERRHSRGHGRVWQSYCAALGIPDERATTACEDFAPPAARRRVRYVLCHRLTGEVFRSYTRAPRRSAAAWSRCYIPHRRAETLGFLELRPVAQDGAAPEPAPAE
ncbi:MAG: SprT-like domain-containing protein [Akkermansia sp.]